MGRVYSAWKAKILVCRMWVRKWRSNWLSSGFLNGGGAGTDHDNYYGNTPAAGKAVDAVPDFVDVDIKVKDSIN